MAFTVPSFPLTCNLFTSGGVPPARPRITPLCYLRLLKNAMLVSSAPGTGSRPMLLGTPKGTDVRSALSSTGADTVEVPANSGRLYKVQMVDDIAKGFANEYRAAAIVQMNPQPTPLP